MESPKDTKAEGISLRLAFQFFFEMGYVIALPALLFGIGGSQLDKTIGTSPLFFILGLGLALTASCLWIAHTVKRILPPKPRS
jgi:F0F1-type ATP synthase assembly protein I